MPDMTGFALVVTGLIGLAHPSSIPQSRKAEGKFPESSDPIGSHRTPKIISGRWAV